MKKFDVQIALEAVKEARAKWDLAKKRFDADVEYVMYRLLNEAAVNYMSAEEVARYSGLTVKRCRQLARQTGLDPRSSKRLLASKAASTLAENAAYLGIEPHEMDLMSPLAYLPMGSQLRNFLSTGTVNEEPEDEVSRNVKDIEHRLRKAFTEPTGWLLASEHVDAMVAHLLRHLTQPAEGE